MKNNKNLISIITLLCFCAIYFGIIHAFSFKKPEPIAPPPPPPPVIKTALYTGKIYHVFFHSLIIYPELAFHSGSDSQGYQDYMVTKSEFEKILPILYKNNFILINAHSLFTTNADGTITKKDLYIPVGKKPLILSLDDVNYYTAKRLHGFANKLVLDADGNVATEVTTPEKQTVVTRNGDTIPIIDDFIKLHPDFSWKGAKGIIAVTGYQGILGYDTHLKQSPTYLHEVAGAKAIVKRLKETGWIFSSHSYSHEPSFRNDTIKLAELTRDTELWDRDVRPLVGDTDIFIGPFGQVFQPNDARRNYLVSKGFKVLFGVGMDLFLRYFPNYMMMDRANIDGIRLIKTPHLLNEFFDAQEVIDPLRFK